MYTGQAVNLEKNSKNVRDNRAIRKGPEFCPGLIDRSPELMNNVKTIQSDRLLMAL